MYDQFDYDRFVDWEGRLAVELAFIESIVERAAAQAERPSILDAACGTGMHGVALARRGWRVVGADSSEGMIERARANSAAAGVETRFEVAGFGQLHRRLGGGFDALLCLGNSLPHILTTETLHDTLMDFAACLRPGGALLIQNLNYDLPRRKRWMAPQSRREGDADWLFVRFYDLEPDGLLTFNMVVLQRDEPDGEWQQRFLSTLLRPWLRDELTEALEGAGFTAITHWGDMQGTPFDPHASPNLVIGATR